MTSLHSFLARATSEHPDRVAVVDPGVGSLTYRELAHLSDRVRDRLHASGVRPGDRVGICARKSADVVAVMYGVLKAGAAYVPVDPAAPAARDAYIMHDCAVKAVIIERRLVEKVRDAFAPLGALPEMLVLDRVGGGGALRDSLDVADAATPAPAVSTIAPAPTDLAYILYTSGSTGTPKGVMLSHENAVTFVDWCSEIFAPGPTDRFSSHAPFHFDLSILDIHVSLKHGATLIIIGEDIGKDPQRLAALIAEERITIWYSAPSILALLAQFGELGRYDYSAMRHLLFAGEVFPVKHLRTLHNLIPRPRYFNLYGPTETNVCTFYEIPTTIPEERTTPFPIGHTCSHLRGRVVDESGHTVAQGREGELCISGPAVMQGYWALPELTARGFLIDEDGTRWYRTGDIVWETEGQGYTYMGRRDRMIKRRGYRIELGEIEAGLYRHPSILEAAVVAVTDDAGVNIRAFLSCRAEKRPSLIELKRFCSEHLPLYMIPDSFSWHDTLPKTSTDKIDYQRLREMD